MLSPELLRETLDTANVECWERERIATPVRAFAVRLHATGCSLRETQAILRLFGVQRSHQAIFQWVHRVADSVSDPPEAKPNRVAVRRIRCQNQWRVVLVVRCNRPRHQADFGCRSVRISRDRSIIITASDRINR